MVDKNRNDSTGKKGELLSGNNILNKFQIFLDNNIRIVRVSCIMQEDYEMKNEQTRWNKI
jgi:hypothetical protein